MPALELHYGQTGDHLEVADVECHDSEAKVQSSSADDQIREVDADSLVQPLAVDTSCQPCHLQRERVHGHGQKEFFDERFAALAIGFCFGPVNTVRQFDGSNGGERSGCLSTPGFDTLQYLPQAIPASLACDQDTGVEDYSHAGGFHGLRFLMISSRSAAKSGSMRGS